MKINLSLNNVIYWSAIIVVKNEYPLPLKNGYKPTTPLVINIISVGHTTNYKFGIMWTRNGRVLV